MGFISKIKMIYRPKREKEIRGEMTLEIILESLSEEFTEMRDNFKSLDKED